MDVSHAGLHGPLAPGSPLLDLPESDCWPPELEYGLLEVVPPAPRQIPSRERLLSHVWGDDFDAGSMRYLRRKLGGKVIETVRGTAYRLSISEGEPGHAD